MSKLISWVNNAVQIINIYFNWKFVLELYFADIMASNQLLAFIIFFQFLLCSVLWVPCSLFLLFSLLCYIMLFFCYTFYFSFSFYNFLKIVFCAAHLLYSDCLKLIDLDWFFKCIFIFRFDKGLKERRRNIIFVCVTFCLWLY